MNFSKTSQRITKLFPEVRDGILNSYTQIFFSNNRYFALILILVSFFDYVAGLSGLISVVVANGVAYAIGFNKINIRSGFYGFNPLLVGLGLGIYYSLSPAFFLVLIFTSVFTLFLTIMLEGIIGKYGLPYLSISFLIAIWTVTLATRSFTALHISERGIYLVNDLYGLGGGLFVKIYNGFNNLAWPTPVIVYFKSLGAIYFQYHLLAGILIAIGLVIYSRIALILSLIGYFAAYLFYHLVGNSITELSYSYIGFNFILTAIAIGGFFIIPSQNSFFWVILLVPLLSLTITSSIAILQPFGLTIFSLPFNIIVLLFLYILKFRERYQQSPEIVIYQQFSPEKNLYSHLNNRERFMGNRFGAILLPFWGEWTVTQAHHGELTHQNEWAHAWDFEITDENSSRFKNGGTMREDYYCYDKPVISPADGTIEEVVDNIDDNGIGDMNLEHNWGNTVIIKHAFNLYTKLSHLKKGSVRVKKGDVISRGDIVAHCGNSGRSPEPHLHFQIQETPFIGSKTLDYPLRHYIRNRKNQFDFLTWAKPVKGDVVSNIEKNKGLHRAFHFIPGQELKFVVRESGKTEMQIVWQVRTDSYNNAYLIDETTNSLAWFRNEGNVHTFTHFEGNRKSLLFLFYLGAYKVPAGFYKGLRFTDSFPLHLMNRRSLILLQDFIAPFYMFIRSEYVFEFIKIKDLLTDSLVQFRSTARVKHGRKISRQIQFEFEVESGRIKTFRAVDGNRKIDAREIKTGLMETK